MATIQNVLTDWGTALSSSGTALLTTAVFGKDIAITSSIWLAKHTVTLVKALASGAAIVYRWAADFFTNLMPFISRNTTSFRGFLANHPTGALVGGVMLVIGTVLTYILVRHASTSEQTQTS